MSHYGDFLKHHQRLLLLLKYCSNTPSLRNTKPLHALVITLGPKSTQPTFLFNNVISIYASVGELSSARKVFDKMPERNVVSFNTIISSYSRSGYVEEAWRIFNYMRNCGFWSTQFTLGGLLSCDLIDFCKGVQLHALIVKNGLFTADVFVGTALLGLYGKHGIFDEVVCAFEDMPKKSLVTWNSIISFFGRYGFVEDCIFFFCDLVREKISLSEGSFVAVLSGFISEQYLESGEQIHGLVIKYGLDNEVSVVNSVINMYVKCMCICSAEKMFEEVKVGDVVSWNTIIGALVKNEKPEKALEFFLRMSEDQECPNDTSFVYVINSCAALQIPGYGKSIHAKIIKNGLECHVFVGSALVDFYVKCDNLEDAHLSFDEIFDKNVVSWNSLILGYANKYSSTSMFLLIDMLQLGYQPNEFTFSHLLKSSIALELSQLHCLIIRMGYQNNEYVLSSLMNSYAKNGLKSDAIALATFFNSPIAVVPSNIIARIYNRSGQYHEALKLLSLLEEPDIVSWNTAIEACAHNVLTACRHGGLVEEGMELFDIMKSNYGVEPEMDHYHCLVDLLANQGYLKEAEKMIATMPFPPNAPIWRSFLGGCRRQNGRI